MLVFSSSESRRNDFRALHFLLSFGVMLFASAAWAQPGGLGCLVDAGISPQEVCIEGYHLKVLSRSGQVMFETFQPGDAWDALDVPRKEKLEDVQNSIFMYVLRVLPEATPLEPNPEWREYTGHVMIVD